MLGIIPRFLRLVEGFLVVDDGIIGEESSERKTGFPIEESLFSLCCGV